MKIGIIGAGNVGSAIGGNWASKGHTIKFGVREPNDPKHKATLTRVPGSAMSTIAGLAADSDVIVLATPWGGPTESAIKEIKTWTGRTLIDATNPWTPTDGLVLGFNTSAAEQVAVWAAGANVVKALNTSGAAVMANPVYGEHRAALFLAGDDAPAKLQVTPLMKDLGFEVVDVGPLKQSRLLEPMAAMWIDLAMKLGQGFDFAFGILRHTPKP